MRQTPYGNIIVRQIEKKPERSDEGERRDTGSDQNNDKDHGGPPATLKAPLVMTGPERKNVDRRGGPQTVSSLSASMRPNTPHFSQSLGSPNLLLVHPKVMRDFVP
jgi:hypothetical protein